MLISRSVHQYRSVKSDQEVLRRRIRELAYARPRWGYRRLTILLRREGWHVNQKRVHRIYVEEELQVRTKKRKKLVSMARGPQSLPHKRNDRWAADFVHDRLADGVRYRALTVIDIYSRECVGIEVAFDMKGPRVTDALNCFIKRRGAKPRALTLDNGTEFRSNHFDSWAYERKVALDFIRPGKPVENAFIESFNGSLRSECLDANWFQDLDEARRLIEQWRRDYNEVRPHSSLGHLPPAMYMASGSCPKAG